MPAKAEAETIVGPVEQTIRDFLRDAPMGSSLTMTGPTSAERVIAVKPSVLGDLAETASRTLSKAGVIFREAIGSPLPAHTSPRVPKPS